MRVIALLGALLLSLSALGLVALFVNPATLDPDGPGGTPGRGTDPEDDAAPRSFPEVGPPSGYDLPDPASAAVTLEVGDDFQEVVDDHPAGTHYAVASGVHRLQQVVPQDGDTFTGRPGAVMSGARTLDPEDFTPVDGLWMIEDQPEDGFHHGEMRDGHEAEGHPEELFADDARLRHEDSTDGLSSGEWHFDYDNDRVWVADDPASFEELELSVTPFAFGGDGVADVTIEELIIEKYASPSQRGAVGGDFEDGREHRDWTIRYVEARQNHGYGIIVAAGDTVQNSWVHHNGHLGMGGRGYNHNADYEAPVTVVSNRINHNTQLGYRWEWEGGGFKFTEMRAGMLVENNWSHHNAGPGMWWDINNTDVVVRSNLAEDNEQAGIFYEISYGADIDWNIARRNGLHTHGSQGAGIYISTSRDVTVTGNAVYDNRLGIFARHADRGSGHDGRYETADLLVRRNDISMTDGAWTGLEIDDSTTASTDSDNRFVDNVYRVGPSSGRPFVWNSERHDLDWWRDHIDRDGEYLEDGTPRLPDDAVEFQQAHYGPTWIDSPRTQETVR